MAERLEDRRLLAVVNWVGDGSDLNWNNPANWSTGELPDAADDVVIADIAPEIAIFHSSGTTAINSLTSHEALAISGGTFEVATASVIHDTLSVGSSSSAYLTGDGDLTVEGLFTWTGGRLRGAGTLIANGGMQLEGNGSKFLERTVNNAGVATWNGGTISTTADGVLNNLAGASFDMQSDNTLSGALGTFNNAGTLVKSAGTGQSSFSPAFNNSGTLHVQSGTLAFSGGGDSSGSFQVDSGSTLRIQDGVHTLDTNSTLFGTGTLSIVNRGELQVDSDISISNLDLLSSSTSLIPVLTGSGNVTVDGLFHWTGGRLQGTGKLITAGSTQMDGTRDIKYLERTVDNAGSATWTDGRIFANADGVFNNLAGATFDAQSDDMFGISTATFNNAGTLVKSAGTGNSNFLAALNNSGTVEVQSGTLLLNGGGGSSSGSFQVDTNGTLRLSSGTFVLNSGWEVSGDGVLRVTGGTLDVASNGSVEANLELGSSSSAYLTGSGDVTVDGLFVWSGGRLRGTGTLIANGGMQLEGSTKYLERTVDNAGVATWNGGTISSNENGVLNNLPGASFDVQSDNTLSGTLGTFNNAGTLLKSAGTGQSSFSPAFNNSGSLHVQSGTLAFSGGGDSSGSFQVDSGSTLRFQDGVHTLDANSTLFGAGTLSIVNRGALQVDSDISISNLDLLSSSTSLIPVLTGSGDVTVDGLFHWTGGRLQGTGKLLTAGSTQMDGIRDIKYLERTVDNSGTATWTDGRIFANADGVFNNLAGATFDAQSDDVFGISTATFNNAGSLLKSAGTGSSNFPTALNNTGTVEVQSGTFLLSGGGGSSSGSFQVDTEGTLRLSSGTFVLNDGWEVTGDGLLRVTGGTLDIASNGSIQANLELGSSTSAYLTGDGNVTVEGLFTWSGGRLRGEGTLIANGGMQLELNTKYLERTLDNAGAATWIGGTISSNENGVLNNLSGASFDMQSNNSLSGLGTFNNAGTLFRSAGAGQVSTAFNNSGAVRVQSGTLALSGGGNSSGSFQVDSDGTLGFQDGVHTLDANSTLFGAGTLSIINRGALQVDSDISVGNLDMLTSSTSLIPVLTGSGDVTVDSLFHWTGGRLQGTGKLITAGSTQIDGILDARYLERTVDNMGSATWTDGRIFANADGVFNNLAGATFDAQSNDLFGISTATFNNAGSLLKSAGTGNSNFLATLNNTGTVGVQSGTLLLSGGGGSSSGSFQVDTEGTLRLSSGTFVLNDGWEVTGDGLLRVTGGTLDIASNGNIQANLELGSSTSSYLTGDGNVTVEGLFTWSGGRLRGEGTLIANGGMQLEQNTKYLERTLDNAGAATWIGGTISSNENGVLNNLPGASFDMQSNNSLSGLGTFNNAGTLFRSAGAGQVSTAFNNSGAVRVQSGTLALSGGGNSSGSFQVDSDGTLGFQDGVHTLDANSTLFGAGTLSIINRGALQVDSDISVGNLDMLTSSTSVIPVLTGTGEVTVDGLFHWTGGRLQGTGKLITAGSTQIDGILDTRYLERTVDNAGSATWTDGRIFANADGVFNNLAGATFDAQSNDLFGTSTATFNNAGSLLKSAGTGQSTFAPAFNNSGSVQVQSGTLAFTGGGYTQTAGVTQLDGGNLTSSTPIDIQGGVLAGFGIVSGDVEMGGLVAANSSVDEFGSLQITGDYIQSPALDAGGPYSVDEDGSVQLDATLSDTDGVLEIEITSLATFDQLLVDGDVTLAGPLNVSLTDGFEPAVDDAFTIVSNTGSDTIIGTFAGLPEGATFTVGNTQFQISYAGGTNNNDVVLTAVNPISPDQGGDTFVFQWDLDSDGIFGESGSGAERGDEVGSSVSFSADGLVGPATFTVGVRAAFSTGAFSEVSTTAVNVNESPADTLPDLVIRQSDISFSPANPNPGESVSIVGNIENLGQLDAADILVEVYDSDTLIEQVTIPSLATGATQEVSVTTSFDGIGLRSITFKLDPLDSIPELNEENNEASRTMQVADSIPPTTSLERTPDANAAGWNNTDVNLILSSVDEPSGSGVSQIVYTINGGAPISENGESVTLSFADEGIYTVNFYALDNALNAESQQSVQIKIDKTAPIPSYSGPFTVLEGSSTLPDGSASIDALSGIQSIAWSIDDGGQFLNENAAIFSGLDGTGTHDVLLRVIDFAGNEAIITSQVVVNNVAPSATISSGSTFTYGQDVTVGFSDPTDPSPDDTAAGFRYSFGLSTSQLANSYLDADESTSWSTQLPVGNYTVYGRIFDRDDDFNDYETTVNVDQATLTITPDDITKAYDGAVFSDFTVSYLGFTGGDDASVLDGSLTFGGPAVGATDAGDYTIEASGLTSDNYVVNFADGQLTIEKANANIVVNGTTVTYDGTEHGATGSVVGVDDQPLTGLALGSSFIDVPGGTANWTFTDATGNYNDATGSVAINILKAAQTIDWDTPGPIMYGTPLSETQLNASVSVVGPAPAGELQYDPNFGTILSIGVNELSVTATETSNYREASASVSLTVQDPNTAPSLTLTSSSVTVERDTQFTLAGSFTDPDADNWTGTVNYGDGSGDQELVLDGKSFNLAHTYDTVGPYVAVVTIDDGKGGVASKNLAIVVLPPPRADLTLISSNILFEPINPSVGDPVNFVITVKNAGTVDAQAVPVSVQVFDGASQTFSEIGRTATGLIPAESSGQVGLTWHGTGDQPLLPVEDAYLLVRVVLDPDNTTDEENEENNEAIQVLQVGSPDFGTANLVADVNPFTTTRGTYTAVGGQAYYDFSTIPGSNDFPVQNASVTARLIDPDTGEVLRVSSDQTAPNGNFLHVFRAPEVDGTYTLQYEVNEGTLSAVFESTLTVAGEPTETPPRPRAPAGPGYVFSPSIIPPENPQIGEEVTIIGSFDYELDIPLLDVPVTFNNLFPVAGQLQTFEIGSGTIQFPEGGLDEPTTFPMQWIPTAEGYHILQVIARPDFDFRARTHATQLVLVGDLDTTSLNVEYSATVIPDLPPGDGDGEGEDDGGSPPPADQTPNPGDTLFFTLQYENTGTTTITGGFLMDDFDETLLGTPTNISDGGVVDGNVIRWELGNIAPGESGFVTYEVTINSGAELPPGSAYLFNTAILNADQSVAANTNELIVRNSAPVISNLTVDSFINQDGNVTLIGTFSDASSVDTHHVSIAWGDGNADTLSFSEGQRSFAMEHHYTFAPLPLGGVYEINVVVTDDSAQTASDSVTTAIVSSLALGVTSEDISVDEGHPASNSGTFSDAVSVVTLTASSGTVSKTGVESGTWTWAADDATTADDTVETVTITATDGVATEYIEFTLTVGNVPVSFSAGGGASLTSHDQGNFSRIDIPFTDPGADQWSGTVDFGDGSGQQVLVIDETAKTFDLNHTYTAEGDYVVTVHLKDDDSAPASDFFEVEVILNQAPIARDDLLVISEDAGSVNITGVQDDSGFGLLGNDGDPDDDSVVITAVNNSTISKGALQLINGVVSFDPRGEFEYLSVGETEPQSFVYTIADPSGETSSATATIAISGENDAPTITLAQALITVVEGDVATNGVIFGDLDASDSLTVAASLGSVREKGDGSWEWTWRTEDGPTDNAVVEISASDGHVTTIDSFELVVVNQPPEFISVSTDATSLESPSVDKTIELTGHFQDAGLLDTHTVTVDWGDGSQPEEIAVNQTLDLFSASHTYANGGFYTVAVTLTDKDGAAVSTATTAAVQGIGLVDGKLWVIGGEGRDKIELEREWRYDGSGWWWHPSNWFEVIEVDARFAEQRVSREFAKSTVQSIEVITLGENDQVEVKRFVDRQVTVRTGEGDDRIDVDSGSATVFAGAGDDRVTTSAGDDFVDGGLGDDDITTRAGNDTVVDLHGDNRVSTGSGADAVTTGDGNDRIETGDDDDIVVSSGGHNRVDTGSGDDSVTLGSGHDRVDLGPGNDIAWLGAGDDRADGGPGDDTLFGEAGNDRLDGGRGNDLIIAGDGDDRIDGDRGLDVLIGGIGSDRIAGGWGDDLLISGWTAYDANLPALQSIFAEWTSEHGYLEKTSNLRQGTGDFLAGTHLLAGATVFDDESEDILDGDAGRDWFFASLEDELKRRRSDELLDLLE